MPTATSPAAARPPAPSQIRSLSSAVSSSAPPRFNAASVICACVLPVSMVRSRAPPIPVLPDAPTAMAPVGSMDCDCACTDSAAASTLARASRASVDAPARLSDSAAPTPAWSP